MTKNLLGRLKRAHYNLALFLHYSTLNFRLTGEPSKMSHAIDPDTECRARGLGHMVVVGEDIGGRGEAR